MQRLSIATKIYLIVGLSSTLSLASAFYLLIQLSRESQAQVQILATQAGRGDPAERGGGAAVGGDGRMPVEPLWD